MDNDKLPTATSWIAGDITVDENGTPERYQYALLMSFATVEDFHAARAFVVPLIDGDK